MNTDNNNGRVVTCYGSTNKNEKNNLFQNKYRTDTLRLKNHDYLHGMYFVTICTKNFINVFGKIINGQMKLNEYGKIVKTEWLKTEKLRNNVIFDNYIIMPNHFHGIISIIYNENSNSVILDDGRDVTRYDSTKMINNRMSEISPKSNSLSSIIRLFKSSCTREIRNQGFSEFKWQEKFYEHIVQNDNDLNNIQNYIYDNPQKWENDKYFKK